MTDYDSYQRDHRPAKAAIFQGYPLISDQISVAGLQVVWRELGRVLQAGTAGDVVELGCYVGTTSLFLRRLLDAHDQSGQRQLHVYDSFEGLPAKTGADTSPAGLAFTAGKLYASRRELIEQFRLAHLVPPIVHKGWFDQLRPADLPERVAFAFLDGDFYDSILSSLRLVWPRLGPGSCLVIDDVQREALPGVDRALHDFFADKTVPRLRVEANKGIIRL